MSLLNRELKNNLQVMANYFRVLLDTCRVVVALHMSVSQVRIEYTVHYSYIHALMDNQSTNPESFNQQT